MTREEARVILQQNGYQVIEEKRLPNDSGWQLKLAAGQVVNVFDNGNCNVQGKDTKRIKEILRRTQEGVGDRPALAAKRSVFVVYGHDTQARAQLEAMLRRWKLEPLFVDQLPSAGQTLIEKLEACQDQVSFGIVLATPDDEGYRAGHPDEKAFRVRQNVVLELGMLLARLGRQRVAILLKDQVQMERPSDIQGLIYIPFKDDVNEAAVPLAKELNAQGMTIDVGTL